MKIRAWIPSLSTWPFLVGNLREHRPRLSGLFNEMPHPSMRTCLRIVTMDVLLCFFSLVSAMDSAVSTA